MTDLRELIADIPHGDGWWHSSNRDTYESLGRRLVADGHFTETEAVDILTTAFHAAADEFGA